MDEAKEQAEREKHEKRMKKLAEGGHETARYHEKFEGKQFNWREKGFPLRVIFKEKKNVWRLQCFSWTKNILFRIWLVNILFQTFPFLLHEGEFVFIIISSYFCSKCRQTNR